MSLSIRWRLALGIAASLLLTLVALFFSLQLALGRFLTADLDRELSQDIDQIRAQLILQGSLEDEEAIHQIAALASGFTVVIRDPQGEVVAATAGLHSDAFALSADVRAEVLAGRPFTRNVDVPDGEELRVRTARVMLGGQPLAIIQAGESREAVTEPLALLRTILVAEGLAAAVLALALAFWLSRGALKPIQEVATVAASIEAADLQRRIGARGAPAEVQKLADTFDAMLGRLEQAFEQQRNFVSDVSHELRTPLTALRGNIDVLLMDDRLDPQTRAQLERMSAEVERLIRLTSNLLYLALADAGRQPERRPVELDVLCLEVYRQAKDLRPEVKLRLGKEDQVSILGDRDLLKQLIMNLVENGLKYTPAGGQVTLSLFQDDDYASIVVEDTGPGIPAEQVPRIFQRFYRGTDSGRRGSGGAGLGLAIADWIARSHGGEITVQSQVGKGSIFTVRLPLPPPSPSASLPGQGG